MALSKLRFLLVAFLVMLPCLAVRGPQRIWGYIDRTGEYVIEPQYWDADSFLNGRAHVVDDGTRKEHFIKRPNKAPPGDWNKLANRNSEELTEFHKDGKTGYVDKSGKIVIEPRFEIASEFREGLAYAAEPSKVASGPGYSNYGFIDHSGKFVIQPQFDQVSCFYEGLAKVKTAGRDGLWGYIDKAGKWVIPAKYVEAHDFHEGLAIVLEQHNYANKWKYVDKQGNQAFDIDILDGQDFSEGLAAVAKMKPR
jgi:WG containing repeat